MIATDNRGFLVLLVEDSDDDAFFFQRAFRKACVDCTLLRAANGKLAIEALSESERLPFVVFLDLKMPVVSGFEVLEWLKVARLEAAPKVYVLSGSNDQADVDRATRLGAAGYLVKPIATELLKSRIAAELELFRHTRVEAGAGV